MEFTRKSFFAGLLAPLVAPKLLEAAKGVSLAEVRRNVEVMARRYESDRFYRMGAEFVGGHPYKLSDPAGNNHILMLNLCANALHRKVLGAAAGRRVTWRAPMELHGSVDWEWAGPIGPVSRCRHLAIWDCVEGRWIHRLDADVAFQEPDEYLNGKTKIGDTIYIRRPRRWANFPHAG